MGAAYSQDLRDRIFRARDRGMTTRQTARLFDVSESWVRRVMQRRREDGQTGPRSRGGLTVTKIDMARLGALVDEQPDATIRQLRQKLGIDCTDSAIVYALQRLGLTFKKRQFMHQNRIARMS